MAVRPARPEDIPVIYRLLSAVIAEGDFLMHTSPPDADAFDQFLTANMRLQAPALVAETVHGLVGWCDVFPKGPDEQRHVGRLGVGVALNQRRQGWGRRLVTQAIAASWEVGFKRLELEVFTHNARAITLYRELGFQREGVHPCTRKTAGGYQHTLTMGLLHAELRAE